MSGEASREEPVAQRRFVQTLALLVAGIGYVVLLGWYLGFPWLTNFGSGLVPVAPSSAILFLLYGLALFLQAKRSLTRKSIWVIVAAACVGAAVSFLMVGLTCKGIHPEVEHVGLSCGVVGNSRAGHMSVVTAFCFILVSLSFLARQSCPAARFWRGVVGGGAAGLLLWISFIFLLAYLYGTPLLYGGKLIPPALGTILAFLMLGFALLVEALQLLDFPHGWFKSGFGASLGLLLIFLLLATGIITIGVLSYRYSEHSYRSEVEHQLSAVADLKVADLVQWRKERLGDGVFLFKNPAFSSLVRRCFGGADEQGVRAQLQEWLSRYRDTCQFDQICLLDLQGASRMMVPSGRKDVPLTVSRRVSEVVRDGQVVFQDFYRDEVDQSVYLGVVVPVFDDRETSRPLGVVFLRIDPEIYLYPFIKHWPTPAKTAETLLVRREGHEVVFLSKLLFKQQSELDLRAPLTQTKLPAARAALGLEGVMDGVDYRGVRVVAATRTVPGSPWALVARMDEAEVYAPTRERLWQVLVMVAVLLFSAGAAVGLIWRQQSVRFYREQFRAEEASRASELRYRRLFETAKDGILILDAETGMVVDVNPFLIEMLGFSHAQFLGKKVWELGFFKDIVANQDNFVELQQKEYIRYEDMALETARGLRVEVEFISSVYMVSHRKVIQCTIRDISERKRAEVALQQSAKELQEKNAELERFLYTASHDLKSPIVTVRTFLGYLEQDMVTAKADRIAQDMQYIRAAVDKMALLLDEVLEISRIGRIVSPPVCVTWRTLVNEALAVVAGRISERRVRILVADQDVSLQGDRLRLAEIWQNLVENAVRFMGDQSSPCIEIGIEPGAAAPVFFVRDNGMGIDPRYQDKVFGLFEKLDTKAEGTGIGLAVVKRVVEVYGGRIWIQSAGQGQGACFYFTLPRAIAQQGKGEDHER